MRAWCSKVYSESVLGNPRVRNDTVGPDCTTQSGLLGVNRFNSDLASALRSQSLSPEYSIFWVMLCRDVPAERTVTAGEAQNILRPWLQRAMRRVASITRTFDTLRWVCAIRLGIKAIHEYLCLCVGLSSAPHVYRMLYLAAIDYGITSDQSLPPITRDSDNQRSSWETLPTEMLGHLALLVHSCVILFNLENFYRSTSRGLQLRRAAVSRLATDCADSLRRALGAYDERFRYQCRMGEALCSAAIPDDIGFQAGDDVFATAMPLVYLPEDRHDRRIAELCKAVQEFREKVAGQLYCASDDIQNIWIINGLQSLKSFIYAMPKSVRNKTGLSPDELWACFYAHSLFAWSRPISPEFLAHFYAYGLVVAPRREYRARMCATISRRLCVPLVEARRIHKQFLATFQPPRRGGGLDYDTSRLHRYMSAFTGHPTVHNGSAVIVDYLGWIEWDLSGWLRKVEIDGKFDRRSRGKVFEFEWASARLKRAAEEHPSLCFDRIEYSVYVFDSTTGRTFTDIDIAIRQGPWLLVIDAKSKMTPDEVLRGESDAVSRRWRQLGQHLRHWDQKMRTVFQGGIQCRAHPGNKQLIELSESANFVAPILLTPRVEWIPDLIAEYIIHPGWPDEEDGKRPAVPRICTMNELMRVLSDGGLQPDPDATWVICPVHIR
jgi:hypothetical protein